MRRSIAQYVAAPWCALAILFAACTGDGAATEDDRHVETPAPKPETPAEPDTPDTPNNPDNPDSTGNYTPKYESAKAVLKEILGDKYEAISAGMPQHITLTAQAIDAVTGISSVLESVTNASSEEHETENMTDAKTKVNTLTEKTEGLEEVLQDTSAEGLEKMLQAFNAEEAKQALQALVAQAEENITLTRKAKQYKVISGVSGAELDPVTGSGYEISAKKGMKVSLEGEFKYFSNHIESLSDNIDISGITISSQQDVGNAHYDATVLIPGEDLKEEIYNKLNLKDKDPEALPTLAFGIGGDKELGLKHFLEIYDTYAYGKSEKFNLTASFGSMDGRTLVEGVAEDEYTLFQADGNTAKASGDGTIKSFDINDLLYFTEKYNIGSLSNLIISGDAPSETVDWQLTNIIFEDDMSQLTNESTQDLKGIVYFKDLPYNNAVVGGQGINGAVRLKKLENLKNFKIKEGSYHKKSVVDLREINKTEMEKYSPDYEDHIFKYIGAVYFNEEVEYLVKDYTFYDRFIYSNKSEYINNEYFGNDVRRNSQGYNKEDATSVTTSKTARKLSEFEYFGNNDYYKKSVKDSYKDNLDKDNFDGLDLLDVQIERLKSNNDDKTIAKVTTFCPLC